jgi:hypothetical protein
MIRRKHVQPYPAFKPRVALLLTTCWGCVIDVTPVAPSPGAGDSGAADGQAGVDALAWLDASDGAEADSADAAAPIPTGTWANATSNLANIPSACGNLSLVSAKPDEDLLIAGIAQVGLWGSRNGGASWQALGAGAGSASITNDLTAIVYDPKDSRRFWESGIYGAGLYETIDDGMTFHELGIVLYNDLISVYLTDPNRQLLLAGGHEQTKTLYRSTDGGNNWSNIGSALPTGSNCTTPLIIDPQTYLVGCVGAGGGPSGVFRTTDGARTWTQTAPLGGGGPPLRATDGAIYWATPGANGLMRSKDNGVTWTNVSGPGVVSSPPIELPGGRLAALGSQYVVVSRDGGLSWSPATSQLPMTPGEDVHGLTYSKQRKAFYIWHNKCGFNGPLPVATDAVMSYSFD